MFSNSSLSLLIATIIITATIIATKLPKIIKILFVYVENGQIWEHIKISVIETMLGLIIGTLIGLFIALLLWLNDFVAKILDPFLVVLNALPKTALAPIIIIWAGTGIKGITMVAISILIVITIISGYGYFKSVDLGYDEETVKKVTSDFIKSVEEEKVKMMKSFKASKLQILFKLILPANFGNIISIIKINIGMAWVGVIVGEFVVSRAGIGYLIVYGSQVFKMDLVMMGVFVLAIIAFIMYEVVNIIEKYIKRRMK